MSSSLIRPAFSSVKPLLQRVHGRKSSISSASPLDGQNQYFSFFLCAYLRSLSSCLINHLHAMSIVHVNAPASQGEDDVSNSATPNNSTVILAEFQDEKTLSQHHLPNTDNPPTDSFDQDSANHIHGVPLVLTLIALSCAVFCVALDMTIIATAIPRITDEFHALQDIGWYGSAYLLTTCGESLLFHPHTEVR